MAQSPGGSTIGTGVETRAADAPVWRALAPAARTVFLVAGAFGGGVLGAAAGSALSGGVAGGIAGRVLVTATAAMAVAGLGASVGVLRWGRTRWRLDAIGLHVRRGLLWHAEVLVPRSRVQHLDITRGPIERRFDVATLVVHTAGTQTHALRLSGLDRADAVALRDALVPDAGRHADGL